MITTMSKGLRELGAALLVAHVLAVFAVDVFGGTVLQAVAAATMVAALCAFLAALVTPPPPTGWARCQLLGGLFAVLLINHY
jgi:hypothetical protein